MVSQIISTKGTYVLCDGLQLGQIWMLMKHKSTDLSS